MARHPGRQRRAAHPTRPAAAPLPDNPGGRLAVAVVALFRLGYNAAGREEPAEGLSFFVGRQGVVVEAPGREAVPPASRPSRPGFESSCRRAMSPAASGVGLPGSSSGSPLPPPWEARGGKRSTEARRRRPCGRRLSRMVSSSASAAIGLWPSINAMVLLLTETSMSLPKPLPETAHACRSHCVEEVLGLHRSGHCNVTAARRQNVDNEALEGRSRKEHYCVMQEEAGGEGQN